MLNRHLLPRWQHVKAQDVSRPDIRALVESIAENDTPVLANRVLALCSKIFAFAVSRDWRPDNPCNAIERPGKEQPRERRLNDDELKNLWHALEREDAFFKALFRLRLLTAARGGEIRHMRWVDIDLDSGWWVIPREHSKNNEPHRVPLTQQACDLLEDLKTWQAERLRQVNEGRRKKKWELKKKSAWVFPSPKGDRPFDWEQRATSRLRERSGVDFRPHDLRRTVATGLTEHCGVDRFILKRILNHVDRDITGVYDRNRYDLQKRTALEAWARHLKGVITDEEQATVVQFSRA